MTTPTEHKAPELPGDIAESLERLGDVESVERLSGGASRLTWRARFSESDPVIVQAERPGSVGQALPMRIQAELLEEARKCDVAVPRVELAGGKDPAWVILEHLDGEALPRTVLSDESLEHARSHLPFQAGQTMARIHTMSTDSLAAPKSEPVDSLRALLDMLDEPHPAFELGLRWLADNPTTPQPGAQDVVVHGDFRLGNLLVDSGGLTGVLDWELAHRGSPGEDLGWFCVRAWRFGSGLRAGGVGTVEQLLEGYADVAGWSPTMEDLNWWEAYGTLRWGLICILQASTHLRKLHRSVELAAIGRRVAECEEDLLEIVSGPSTYYPTLADEVASSDAGPHDRPTSEELLEAVSEFLTNVRQSASGSQKYQLRVSENVIDMVRREVILRDGQHEAHRRRLDSLGVDDDRELAAGIRAGSIRRAEVEVAAIVRECVRDKLAVSKPRYWEGDQ